MKASERHKLKEDEFARLVHKAGKWARQNQTVILTAIVIVLVVVIGVVWVTVSRRSAEQTAESLLRNLEIKAQSVVLMPDEKRAEALEKIMSLCDRIVAEYPSTDAAPHALRQTGEVLSRVGRTDEAVSYFERALKLGSRRPGAAILARRGLAEALEELGKLQEAIEQYGILAQDATSPLAAQANWDIGRCYDRLWQPDKAAVFYGKVVDYADDTDWGRMARSRLARGAPPTGMGSEPAPLPVPGTGAAGRPAAADTEPAGKAAANPG